jgi:nicotinate-nucleotide adenylyltransferase
LRKIGFLGGSFDPVHDGHVRLAQAALDALALEELRFIPAAQSWQKGAPGANGAQRAAMLRLATAPFAHMQVDERELTRGGASYTIDTARSLREELGPDVALFLVLGADQFLNLPTWREWQALFDLVNFAVAGRPGYGLDPQHWSAQIVGACALRLVMPSRVAPVKAFGAVHMIEMAPADISATHLRDWLARRGGDADAGPGDFLPAPVLDYIERHHLYLET